MNNLMMYVGIHFIIAIVALLFIVLVWRLTIGRALVKRKKMWDDELEAMHKRIKRRKELNGRATKHEVDLAAKEGRGGWTGEVTDSYSIKPSLSKPHPFYTKEVDDE